ncbi:hypothetical protein HD_0463 [[Haemophilus] ducreyi 35000HP]|uniref:Uncharacterized protein n=1 Tax=Haemophilus ducreyi (strain 35000HP / ATCC 700724) TaxID=233412 RepID=Q7VNM9_HAEDU|nr:hypothetical protein HD_0463 [[Haemophilus] ducreyi 35000HP]
MAKNSIKKPAYWGIIEISKMRLSDTFIKDYGI